MAPLRLLALLACPLLAPAPCAQSAYQKDVAFALRELEAQCGRFFGPKGIDWKAVTREFGAAAKAVKTDQDHYVLLTRLLARLEDGHAAVRTRARTQDVRWPDDGKGPRVGCGMFWCRIGQKLHVKTVWGSAAEVGIEPGMEVVSVAGLPARKWLDARIAALRDFCSFSTDHQAFFFACHAGLAEPVGTRLELELREPGGARKKRTITFSRGNPTPQGPAVFPPDLKSTKDLRFGVLKSGFGYIRVRRCKEDLPQQMDEALAAVGGAGGLVLDFRANSGGGFDHDALMGRFVPKGQTLAFGKRYASAGPHPYGGRVVVIVDGTVVSAGETAAGQFKEDGRAYMIGESPTAGMSASKVELELPSGLFALYVSVASNKGRFNGGKGIEGIGVVPHALVEFDAKDLAAGIDTLIARAETLLADFPQNDVPYRPR
jgi:C-terminal processing protease CtpA/Prc